MLKKNNNKYFQNVLIDTRQYIAMYSLQLLVDILFLIKDIKTI